MSKSIGIIAATELEIAPILGKLSEKKIKYCITGIGAAALTYNTLQFIHNEKPGILIQAGISGCFDNNISLSSVFIIKQDRFADLGVEENNEWKDIFDMHLADPNSLPYKNGWLINEKSERYNPNDLQIVAGISVNEVSTSLQKIHLLKQKYDPVVESMEGAAFHYVCMRQNISFLQIRAVSNYLGERNKSNWEIEKSILHMNKELCDIIDLLRIENL